MFSDAAGQGGALLSQINLTGISGNCEPAQRAAPLRRRNGPLAQRHLQGAVDVGLQEIIPDKEQTAGMFPGCFIGEAIAEVQTGRMHALAPSRIGFGDPPRGSRGHGQKPSPSIRLAISWETLRRAATIRVSATVPAEISTSGSVSSALMQGPHKRAAGEPAAELRSLLGPIAPIRRRSGIAAS